MGGMFELFHDGNLSFRFRLTAPDGAVMAVSGHFPDKASAVEGIRAVRECAGMGLITDLCPAGPAEGLPHRQDQSSTSSAGNGPGFRRGEDLPGPFSAHRSKAG